MIAIKIKQEHINQQQRKIKTVILKNTLANNYFN